VGSYISKSQYFPLRGVSTNENFMQLHFHSITPKRKKEGIKGMMIS
jgi:hypothetical protein